MRTSYCSINYQGPCCALIGSPFTRTSQEFNYRIETSAFVGLLTGNEKKGFAKISGPPDDALESLTVSPVGAGRQACLPSHR